MRADRFRLRRRVLYPLSYGRVIVDNRQCNMGLRGAVRFA
jgi:hypothetical protein